MGRHGRDMGLGSYRDVRQVHGEWGYLNAILLLGCISILEPSRRLNADTPTGKTLRDRRPRWKNVAVSPSSSVLDARGNQKNILVASFVAVTKIAILWDEILGRKVYCGSVGNPHWQLLTSWQTRKQ